ncbi:MAG: hypothetical protein ACYCSO_08910 [Cuniculiplasma sp.]
MRLRDNPGKLVVVILIVILFVGVFAPHAILINQAKQNVPKSNPYVIIKNNTVYNISAANGFVIGYGPTFIANNSGVLTGRWNSTEPTNFSLWFGNNKQDYPRLTANSNLSEIGVVNLSMRPGNYTLIFQTSAGGDNIHILSNFTFHPVN